AIHYKWMQTFWQSFGILRTNPEVKNLMEAPATRYVEAQLDNAWSGAIAPGAELIGYACPDSKNTAMVFCYNEATTRAQGDGVSVLTDSFCHREDSEPPVVRWQYSNSALVGAAMGITQFASSGDSAQTDTPSVSHWVTAVGGTQLQWSGNNLINEVAWNQSGSGESEEFYMPDWQVAVAGGLSERRMTADLSAAASTGSPYWVYYNSQWLLYGGTSFASPVMAGIVAVANQYRAENGMGPLGYLNQTLYTDPAVQATFRDITSGATQFWSTSAGWDPVSGWGTPHALEFAQAVP
ncbi:MAG: S53 family peptidase, partial [Myxococcales bacterium]|nr:S53 family peptidase [Myxococcales bacterium]